MAFPDDVLAHVDKEKAHDLTAQRWVESLPTSPVFDINNVAAYYHETTLDNDYSLKDFPCLTPVYDNFFMWYHAPAIIRKKGGDIVRPHSAPKSIGALICAVGEGDKKSAVLMVIAVAYADGGPIEFGTDGVLFKLDGQGNAIENGGKVHMFVSPDAPNNSERVGQLQSMLNPCLLALSFLHCQNVAKTEVPRASAKLQRRRAKDGKRPMLRQSTIIIEPMKRVLSGEGNIGASGLKKALHIARGHFKTFGGENGKLFGRIEGRFWFPHTVRGSKQHGEVKSTYAIRAPHPA